MKLGKLYRVHSYSIAMQLAGRDYNALIQKGEVVMLVGIWDRTTWLRVKLLHREKVGYMNFMKTGDADRARSWSIYFKEIELK